MSIFRKFLTQLSCRVVAVQRSLLKRDIQERIPGDTVPIDALSLNGAMNWNIALYLFLFAY
ncbi:MAG: hypothetical protein IT525_08565 [Nitrosomonas sp.]|jgi:hypothetical protein|nr:hypothetical protein [Nitrosomonas sp.]